MHQVLKGFAFCRFFLGVVSVHCQHSGLCCIQDACMLGDSSKFSGWHAAESELGVAVPLARFP